jgi:hypothetical protein
MSGIALNKQLLMILNKVNGYEKLPLSEHFGSRMQRTIYIKGEGETTIAVIDSIVVGDWALISTRYITHPVDSYLIVAVSRAEMYRRMACISEFDAPLYVTEEVARHVLKQVTYSASQSLCWRIGEYDSCKTTDVFLELMLRGIK